MHASALAALSTPVLNFFPGSLVRRGAQNAGDWRQSRRALTRLLRDAQALRERVRARAGPQGKASGETWRGDWTVID